HALLAASELAMWSSAPAWAAGDEHPVALAKRALEAAGDDASLAARAHTADAARQGRDRTSGEAKACGEGLVGACARDLRAARWVALVHAGRGGAAADRPPSKS